MGNHTLIAEAPLSLPASIVYKENLFTPDLHRIVFFFFLGIVVASLVFLAGRRIANYGRSFYEKPRTPFPPIYFLPPAIIGFIAFTVIYPALDLESIHNMEDLYVGYPRGTSVLSLLGMDILYNHLPFFRMAVSIISIFNDSLIAIRTMSAIVHGLAAIPFYNLVRVFFDKRSATLTTILFALAPIHLYYSKVALPYCWLLFFSTAYLWLFFISFKKIRVNPWPLIICGTLGCYVHQFFSLLIAGSLATLFITSRTPEDRRERVQQFALVFGTIIKLASPLVITQVLLLGTNSMLMPPNIMEQIQLLQYPGSPTLFAIRDVIAFPGMFFILRSAESTYLVGTVIIFVLAIAYSFRANRSSPVFIMSLVVFILYFGMTVFYHNTVFRNGMQGWIPMWRHGLELAPLLFLLVASMTHKLFHSGKGKIVYVIFCILLTLQCVSAQRMLKSKNTPDTRGASEYVMNHVHDGDALVSFPSPVILSSTFNYHFFPRETVYGEYPSWIKLGKKVRVLADCSDQFTTFKTLERNNFIRRAWKIKYDSKYFGIFPEFDNRLNPDFERAFEGWRVVEEKKLPFISIQLMEAPPPDYPEDDKIEIIAGTNDFEFARGMIDSVFIFSASRVITSEGELVVPVANNRQIKKVEIFYEKNLRHTIDVSPVNDRIYSVFKNGTLHIISLKSAAGIMYDTIIVYL